MKSGRYIRQTALPGFGPEGQRKLAGARVLVVGLGGLGLPVLQYLNAMGTGTLGIVDQDDVELTNLQRQVLYTEADIGRRKIEVVEERLSAQNSSTVIHSHDTFLTSDNALEILEDYDVVVDASDNFGTRYLINDSCVILNKPFVYGALHGFEGHISVFNQGNGPTYRCLFPEIPAFSEIPDCNRHGVLGVIPGIVGTLQAVEAVKLITGIGEVMSGKLLLYNGLDQSIRKINIAFRKGNRDIRTLAANYQPAGCIEHPYITGNDFHKILASGKAANILDVRSAIEFSGYHLPGSLNIPPDELRLRWRELDPRENWYIVCHSGMRSLDAQRLLNGLTPALKTFSLAGGLLRYRGVFP